MNYNKLISFVMGMGKRLFPTIRFAKPKWVCRLLNCQSKGTKSICYESPPKDMYVQLLEQNPKQHIIPQRPQWWLPHWVNWNWKDVKMLSQIFLPQVTEMTVLAMPAGLSLVRTIRKSPSATFAPVSGTENLENWKLLEMTHYSRCY